MRLSITSLGLAVLSLLLVAASCGQSSQRDANAALVPTAAAPVEQVSKVPTAVPDEVALVDELASTPGEAGADKTAPPFELKPIELPPRPQHLMPEHRIVAFYGVPGVPGMGTLGNGSANDMLARLMDTVSAYEALDKPVIPAFEIMATVAQAAPGADGNYSHPIPVQQLWDYLEVIRSVDGIMIVDFQTGRDEYMDQIPAYEDLLMQPDVHVALDPEWEMGPYDVPNQIIGSSDAASINQVMAYLDELVVAHELPPKIVVLHQFQHRMITNRDKLDAPDTVQMVLHMDGHGPPQLKWDTYTSLAGRAPFINAFKLFYQRDIPLMSPADALALEPAPDLISYQ